MADPITCEILSQGDEVVTGQITDTNAAWLAEQLTDLGFLVTRHTTVGDRLDDLVAAVREIAARSDVCICTGGLGPTEDDLTAQAVADALGEALVLDPVALEQIEERFRQFGRVMAPVNRKQALLPPSAQRIENRWGTAPGFAFPAGRCWFACLPGVPREMRPMFEQNVLPQLLARFPVRPGRLVTLRTLGVGESDLQQALRGSPQQGELADGVVVGFRTKLPENHLKLRFHADVPPERIQAQVASVLERVGRWVYTIEGLPEPIAGWDCEGGDPAAVVGRLLVARGETLAVAESCTGGRFAAACTAVAGASEWFIEGVVSYANEAKVSLVGVPAEMIAAHGAVSEPVARAMASGIRARAGTSWGVGITGIAGPGGGSPEKPVGTVHVAIHGYTGRHTGRQGGAAPLDIPRRGSAPDPVPPDPQQHRLLRLPASGDVADRERIQSLAVAAALELLRRALRPSP